jgi:hypothetical protein
MSERRPTPDPIPPDDEHERDGAPITAYPAAPKLPAAAPRRRSGGLDEPIESGEIVERRSRVVRSTPGIEPLSKIELRDDPTEPVQVVHVPVPRPRSRSLRFLWLAAALVLAGGGIAMPSLIEPSTTAPTAARLERAVLQIASSLDTQAAGVQVRAEGIATTSKVREGIVTDAATVADMARDNDLVFPVKEHEVCSTTACP